MHIVLCIMLKNSLPLHADALVGPFNFRGSLAHPEAQTVRADDVMQVRLRFRADNDKDWAFVLNKSSQAHIEQILENFAQGMDVSTAKEAVQALDRHFRTVFSDKSQLDDYNQHDFTLEDVELTAGGHVYHSRHGLPDTAYDFTREASFTHTHDPEIGPNSEWHTHPTAVRVLLDDAGDGQRVEALPKLLQQRMGEIIDRFFSDENDFSNTTLEDAGAALFKRLVSGVPELHQELPLYVLKDVRFTIEYDGSLDHPEQTIEFSRSVKEQPDLVL